MGWSERLPSGKYRAVWRDLSGRKRSHSGHRTVAEAKRYAGQQELAQRRGEITADGRSPTWGDWSKEWLTTRAVEPSTARQDMVRLERHVAPRWDGVRLNRVRRDDVQAWVNDLARTPSGNGVGHLAPATVDRIFRLFSASMKAAAVTGLVGVSPCVGITLPTAAPGHERFLTRAEFDQIAHHLDEPYKSAAVLLVATGMRFGEMAGLHWQRVDMVSATIDVIETWDATDQRIKAYPKGRKRRVVPVPPWAMRVLAGLHEQTTDGVTCGLDHAGGARCRSQLVAPAPRGGPLDAHNMGQRDWATAVKLAHVDHVRLHDLRHTYASWLVQAGVPLLEVGRLLGHASIVTTSRYSHLGTTQHDAVRAALG